MVAVDRQSFTMRHLTGLTNAFSKKIDNHVAAIALHFMHYNFCRVNKTLRVTPCDGGWRRQSRLDG